MTRPLDREADVPSGVNLVEKMEREFDPSDCDRAQRLAHHSLLLLRVCARVLRDEQVGLRMGRDNAGDMHVKAMQVASDLGLLNWNSTGTDFEQLYRDLIGG